MAQEQDSCGRKGTREKELLARWLGVCNQMEGSVPGPCSPGRPVSLSLGIRFQWPEQVSSSNVWEGGNSILHGLCLLLPCSLTAHFVCFCSFHELEFDDSCFGSRLHGNNLSVLWCPLSNNHDCFLRHFIGTFLYLSTSSCKLQQLHGTAVRWKSEEN